MTIPYRKQLSNTMLCPKLFVNLRSTIYTLQMEISRLKHLHRRSESNLPIRFATAGSCRTLITSSPCHCMGRTSLFGLTPEVIEKKTHFIVNCLDIPKDDSLVLVSQYWRMNHGVDNLDKLVVTLQRIQLNVRGVLEHPRILTYLPKTIEHRYHRLVELGVDRPHALDIIGFTKIVTKTTKPLKEAGLITSSSVPLDAMIRVLDGPPNLKQIIDEQYSLLKDENVDSMHAALFLEYLMWRLGISQERVMDIINKYRAIRCHSLHSIVNLWNLLTSHLGFTAEKIKTNGFLLMLHTNDVQEILLQLPELCGCDIKTLILKFPRILSMPIDYLQTINKCLHEYGVTSVQIEKCANVLTLRPSTIRKRLEEMENISEFKEMRSYPRFLYLLYYQEKAKRRLKLMKQIGYKEFTIDILCTSEQYFNNFIDSNDNKQFRADFISFLSKRLNCPKTKIRFKLQPYSLNAKSLDDANKNLDYLFKCGFSSDEIKNSAPIVLHELSSIQKQLKDVHGNDGSSRTEGKSVLSLVLEELKASTKCKGYEESSSQIKELKYGRYVLVDDMSVRS